MKLAIAGTLLLLSVGMSLADTKDVLQTLRLEHPRLLANAEDFARVRRQMKDVPLIQQWAGDICRKADETLKAAPSKYEIPDGLRLLATSQRVLDRTYTLAMAYRLTDDRRYAKRLWLELSTAAQFKDWNPRHFLDTAEMTHAFAIGYDWLYDVWTLQQRTTLREAILKLGLEPALKCYRGEIRDGWWSKATHNWNQVCNGGITLGALAVADEAPEIAEEIVRSAVKSVPLALASYAPDGAWGEGPGYWDYATRYTVFMIAGLNSALGHDFGLSKLPGFNLTGTFPGYLSGPTGIPFNFADAGHVKIHRADLGYRSYHGPHLFWLSWRFDLLQCAWQERKHATPHPLDLIWFDPRGDETSLTKQPLDRYFRGVEVATMRSSWTDRDATFVGFKAGNNKVNHGHLDLGSFVLDALGVRWALDIGADDYNLPGYFGKQRWDYYRLRAEGHNTLVINPGQGPDQDPSADTKITRFVSDAGKVFAIADLTPANAGKVERWERGVRLLDRRAVLVQDEITAGKAVEAWWFMNTVADPVLSENDRTAMLTVGSARLCARLLEPVGATFSVRPASPLPSSPNPDGQGSNAGIRKLSIHLQNVTSARVVVLLMPLRKNDSIPEQLPAVKPLAEW